MRWTLPAIGITVAGGHAIPRMEDLLEAFPNVGSTLIKAWPVVEPLGQLIRRLRSMTEYALAHLMMSGFSGLPACWPTPVSQYRGTRSSRFRLAAWLGLNAYFTADACSSPSTERVFLWLCFSGACP